MGPIIQITIESLQYGQIIIVSGCYGFSYCTVCSTVSPLKQGHVMHFFYLQVKKVLRLIPDAGDFRGSLRALFLILSHYNPCQEGRGIHVKNGCKHANYFLAEISNVVHENSHHAWLLESLILMTFSTLESQLLNLHHALQFATINYCNIVWIIFLIL